MELIQYNNYIKPTDKLPEHITFRQYQELREKVIPEHYDSVKIMNKRNEFLKVRDKLLIDMCFATGGRIGDVVNLEKKDIDFDTNILTLFIHKTTKIGNPHIIKINLDNDLCYDIIKYIERYKIIGKMFPITRQACWKMTQKFGLKIGLKLHPHMFRHGLALYLLSMGVPIPVISYRLGHKDVRTTMQMYLKVTPDIERNLLFQQGNEIKWR